jgi:hypothetical protein
MVDLNPDIDHTTVFTQLWDILGELRQKLDTRFTLHPNPSKQELQSFSSPDGSVNGSLMTFSGSEIDWLVHSWLNHPKRHFSTMRLTVWLGTHIRVPHLAFEFGTVPTVFFYMDYVPRADLWSDLNYVEHYYEPVNSTYLALRDNPHLSLFTSKSLYVRQFQSPIHLCYTCQTSQESLQLIKTIAHDMLERWLRWVDEAEPVPEEARTALGDRDLRLRRISTERDPGNQLAAQLFGSELTDTLVRSLWSSDDKIS